MARHANIYTSIWDDKQFVALDPSAQSLYLMLLAYKGLSWCGVIDYLPNQLRKFSAAVDVRRLDELLRMLAADRFIVIDDEADEILIRTYVRHDGILSQPNIVKGMVRDLSEVRSPMLRQAVISELARAHRDDDGAAGWGVIEGRGNTKDVRWSERYSALICEIVDAWTQPQPVPRPLSTPNANPYGDPNSKGSRTSLSLDPGPLTLVPESLDPCDLSPSPTQERVPESSTTPREDSRAPREDVDQLCALLADRIATRTAKRPVVTHAWRTQCRLMLDRDSRTVDEVTKAIWWLESNCKPAQFWITVVLSMPTLREKFEQMRLQAARPDARAGPGSTAHPRSRHEENADAVRRMQEREATATQQLQIGSPR